VTGVIQDARCGLRLLRREPGFSLLAILTIALGVAATTTLFSVTYGVLMRPLPWPDSDRLVRLSEKRQGHSPRIPGTITNGTYNAWHEAHAAIDGIAGWLTQPRTAVIGGGAEPARLQTVFAVLIAGVGLFGVLSYSVAQRVREIGVRTALGATASDIVLLVVGQASAVAVDGTFAGLWLSAASVRVLSTFLFGVGPYDLATFGGVAMLVLVVSAVAAILPARRAARIDPLVALRS
jgi:FtsX-like permease family protein/MacB-like protein